MTFFHHSGQSFSQIDYILLRNLSIYKQHKIWNRSATNIPAHVPVETKTIVKIPSGANRKPSEGTSYKKLLWDEIDTETYNSKFSEGLLKIQYDESTSDQLQTITNELTKATKLAVPAKPINPPTKYNNYRFKAANFNTACDWSIGEKENSHSNQRKVFAKYYEDLYMPKDSEYDNSYLEHCKTRLNLIEKFYKENPATSDPYTEKEIQNSMENLNIGKLPDEHGLTAEHLKYAKMVLTPVLTTLFNKIKEINSIPKAFKTMSRATEEFTVTSIIGKVHELCILKKLQLLPGPDLQFGFTEGLCPLMARLLITEAKCEKLPKNIPLFITTVDVQSAFDVVKHIILMDKLLDQTIPTDLLQLTKGLYTDLESKIKWMGDTSDTLNI
ncbi:RYR1 [Mytilus coruscus]|uniref:RYR1 n=1 Tax=Mytilus coruscus TaxID=42192 RepID=A0A6J8EFP7_MYTCO|nr:RYR1 [Mytilus coruscus]